MSTTYGGLAGASTGEEATIVLSGIGKELSDGMLTNMYRTYGPIVRVRHNGTNSAYVATVSISFSCVACVAAMSLLY